MAARRICWRPRQSISDLPLKQKGRLKGRPPVPNESRSNAQRARLGSGIALGDLVPVHGIPPGLEVIGAAAVVNAIVIAFPDAAAHQIAHSLPDLSVLAPARVDHQPALLPDRYENPAPT